MLGRFIVYFNALTLLLCVSYLIYCCDDFSKIQFLTLFFKFLNNKFFTVLWMILIEVDKLIVWFPNNIMLLSWNCFFFQQNIILLCWKNIEPTSCEVSWYLVGNRENHFLDDLHFLNFSNMNICRETQEFELETIEKRLHFNDGSTTFFFILEVKTRINQ